MKSRFAKFRTFFFRKRILIPLVLIVAGLIWYFSSNSNNKAETILTVQPSTFLQDVAVTGKVVPAKNVDMGFETSARVSKVYVSVGDSVKQGQILASVSNGDQQAIVAQRQAQVDAQAAKLAQAQKGSRPEDITIAQTSVDGAKTTYAQSLQSLVDQIKDSYSKVDDAVRSKADQLFKDPRTINPDVISFDSYVLRQSVNSQRLAIGEMLTAWSSSISNLSTDNYSSTYLSEARTNLATARRFLNDLGTGVSSLVTSAAIPQTTIDKYTSDISSARTSIGASISALESAQQAYLGSQTAYKQAQDQLALKKAGSTPEEIATQAANLQSARADLQSAQALLYKTNIVAPFDGLITKVDTKEGEIASINANVISLISASTYEVDSYISENDIAKIKVGQPAKVTLDAYGKDVVFDAAVVEVDPAETVLDGVSTYKTKLQFTVNDPRIKSGMTANITIQTAEKPDTLVVPQQALFLTGGEKMVTVVQANGSRVDKPVVTGGINDSGDIEIISGLSIGDKVVVKNN